MTEKKGAKKLNQRKEETVAQLTEKFTKAKSFFLTDYRGLTHQQLEMLKKTLKKVEGEFLVAKNTLFRIAMKPASPALPSGRPAGRQFDNETKKSLEEQLKNPTAALFAYGDEISAIKALSDFIKTTQLPKIKIGVFGGNLSTEVQFKILASLPTRNELLAMLVGRLESPIYGLHYALNWNLQRLVTVLDNIKNTKSNVKPA